MEKGTKLFDQSKGTKEIERNPVNLKKVRDFVSRYSEDPEFSFSSAKDEELAAVASSSPASGADEKSSSLGKKARGKATPPGVLNEPEASVGSSSGTVSVFDSPAADHPFPIIDFPSVKQRKDQRLEEATQSEGTRRFTFAPATEVPREDEEAGLPQIQPISFTRESPVDSEPQEHEEPETSAAGVGVAFTLDSNGEFRIIDDNFAEDDPEQITSTAMEDGDPNEAPVEIEAMIVVPSVDETTGDSSEPPPAVTIPDETLSFTSAPTKLTAPRRRTKKKSLRIGKGQEASSPELGDENDVMLLVEEAEASAAVAAPSVSSEENKPKRKRKALHSSVISESESPLTQGEPQALAGPAPKRRRQIRVTQDLTAPLDVPQVETRSYEEVLPSVAPSVADTQGKLGTDAEILTKLDPCLVSFSAPESFEAEQYRVLRYLVERLRGEKEDTCIIAVTSPSAGDGKTTTALNLAGALAQSPEARVLLIDADLRRPAIDERLGRKATNSNGLADMVTQPTLTLQGVLVRYEALNLSVLSAGHAPTSSYEVFKSPRFSSLLMEARRQYDYIIIDTPPLVPVSDCRLIGKLVDGFFIVVGAHKTPRKLVQEALAIVAEEKILGLVLNGGDPPVFGYDKYYGYASNSEGRTSLRRDG